MKSPYDTIRRPIFTEKTTNLAEKAKYTLEVMPGTNKVEIKKAIEEIFNVNVVSVNIVNVRRKSRKVGKYSGFRPAVRKAIVTLEAGQTLDVFEV